VSFKKYFSPSDLPVDYRLLYKYGGLASPLQVEAPWLVHAEIARKNIPRRTPLARTILWHQSKGLVETFRSIYCFWKSGNFQESCVAFTVGDPERAKWNPPYCFRAAIHRVKLKILISRALPCFALPCFTVLYRALPCFTVLHRASPCFTVLYWAMYWWYVLLYRALPWFTGQCIDGMYRLLRLGSIGENSKEEG
jgi:hypothetical protein